MRWKKCITPFKIKGMVKQLHKGLLLLLRCTRACECMTRTNRMEENVRGGHFSAVAVGTGEPKKFVVRLRYLMHPKFMELLDKAEREFGFDQRGVLVIPCEAKELQSILSGNAK